ncbi:hypothetical protein ARMGADRAFT_1029441 [Armillaria gallica]|uniref:Uncharacterized protein n=1 Tax=Armillaria gallica TaxID=47427 RepID=A0A2H3DGE9_ARMGA|nr:hypothetical protein ARMGADRAFT_1029441 [Armillaria gallica]
MEIAPTKKEVQLPPIPPEPYLPPPLKTEEQYGDPFKYPCEITKTIHPLLLADGGPASADIKSALDLVHPLLVNYVEELKNNTEADDQVGILLHQTCYALACKTPPHYHKMKEWSIWAPTVQEYNVLGSDEAIGKMEQFDPILCYKNHKAQYLNYKNKWTTHEKEYREALRNHQKALDAHKKARQAKEAAEMEAKQALEEKKSKLLAAAGCAEAQASLNMRNGSAKDKKDPHFKIQTPKSMQ